METLEDEGVDDIKKKGKRKAELFIQYSIGKTMHLCLSKNVSSLNILTGAWPIKPRHEESGLEV